MTETTENQLTPTQSATPLVPLVSDEYTENLSQATQATQDEATQDEKVKDKRNKRRREKFKSQKERARYNKQRRKQRKEKASRPVKDKLKSTAIIPYLIFKNSVVGTGCTPLSIMMKNIINTKKKKFAMNETILNIGCADKICYYCKAHMWEFEQSQTEKRKNNQGFSLCCVDAWACIEHARLKWVLKNQNILRSDVYNNIVDSVNRGDVDASAVGKKVILPSSFTGSLRYMQQNYQDCMAVCRRFGSPDLFITFTCNPKWPKIQQFCDKIKNVTPAHRPDIMARVFKIKLDLLLEDLCRNHVLGKVIGVVYNIEFQKRDYMNETTIDSNGYPLYKRRNNGRVIMCKDVAIDNRFIVPYNRGLILKYQAHINVKLTSTLNGVIKDV
ncbi:hypothetical protein POM88_052222 [Heracleum sosnowskyi]|uniref:Helitron helicase-like domain-containing protein n=1 Tax=Heracleum sosnowskyi TaxID=360622 RepID=A0AAD8GRJ0_9APIA|nr:hypothetical protein POM88_052222 [Heracleum sosnowskyi]